MPRTWSDTTKRRPACLRSPKAWTASSAWSFARTSATGIAGATGIAVSYWRDLSCLRAWRHDAEHLGVQLLGQQRFYRAYRARICLVEREYEWHRGNPTGQAPDIPRWDAAR